MATDGRLVGIILVLLPDIVSEIGAGWRIEVNGCDLPGRMLFLLPCMVSAGSNG